MTNDHDIVFGVIKTAPCFVRDWYIVQHRPALKGERRYSVKLLIYQSSGLAHCSAPAMDPLSVFALSFIDNFLRVSQIRNIQESDDKFWNKI
jgi:hypothetical protein